MDDSICRQEVYGYQELFSISFNDAFGKSFNYGRGLG